MWTLGNFKGVLARLVDFAENYPPETYRECE